MASTPMTTAEPRPAAARPTEAAIADPAPLGLAGFGLTTLILSIVNAGWFGNAAIVPLTGSTLSMAVAYGGLAQFVAGLWAFRRGNTFAGTAFCSYGAFWFSFFLLVQVYLGGIIKAAPNAWLGWVGLYLLALGHLHRLHDHRVTGRGQGGHRRLRPADPDLRGPRPRLVHRERCHLRRQRRRPHQRRWIPRHPDRHRRPLRLLRRRHQRDAAQDGAARPGLRSSADTAPALPGDRA